MPRKIVPLVTGEVYHIFNRGVDKREVFLDKGDYLRFYRSLQLFNQENITFSFRDAARCNRDKGLPLVSIEAYALLPNHFHMIVKQLKDGGISEFMKRISSGYTGYFNEKYERSGSLFQGTFKRVHIETDRQYNYLLAYVNENHFVHGMNTKRELYHSSSLHYQQINKSVLIHKVQLPYDAEKNITLAKKIYAQRQKLKGELLEE